MRNEVMICGVDCQPGDGHCNNYCNHDTSTPMASHPPAATPEQIMCRAVKRAEMACEKADAAVEELRQTHNELFAEGFVAGMQKLAESCERRRETLNLIQGKTK